MLYLLACEPILLEFSNEILDSNDVPIGNDGLPSTFPDLEEVFAPFLRSEQVPHIPKLIGTQSHHMKLVLSTHSFLD